MKTSSLINAALLSKGYEVASAQVLNNEGETKVAEQQFFAHKTLRLKADDLILVETARGLAQARVKSVTQYYDIERMRLRFVIAGLNNAMKERDDVNLMVENMTSKLQEVRVSQEIGKLREEVGDDLFNALTSIVDGDDLIENGESK